MSINFVRRPPNDVDMAAIGFPAWNAGCEMLVCVGDAAIMFFLEFVDGGIGIGIAALKNHLDKLFALFICTEPVKSRAFFWGDDVDQVFIDDVRQTVAEFVSGFLDLLLRPFLRLRALR